MSPQDRFIKKHEFVIQFVGGILATAITVTVFLFTTFESKADSSQTNERIFKAIDRLEQKIDKIIEWEMGKNK